MLKGNQRTHRERRVVAFSPEQFFAVVADVDNYKKFVPFCVDSKVLRVIDEGTMEAEMSVGFKVKCCWICLPVDVRRSCPHRTEHMVHTTGEASCVHYSHYQYCFHLCVCVCLQDCISHWLTVVRCSAMCVHAVFD